MSVLDKAVEEALFHALMGGRHVPLKYSDSMMLDQYGNAAYNVSSDGFLGSIFQERLNHMAASGKFDELLEKVVGQLDPERVALEIETKLSEQIIAGLEKQSGWQNRDGWVQAQARSMATQAMQSAMSSDEELLQVLRERIGMSVDRDQVEINLELKPREPGGA